MRKLQLAELEEIRNDAYDSAKRFKARTKARHDKMITQKTLEISQKVLLYDSRLHLFPGKLRSRWTSPYLVKKVYPYGAVEIFNLKNGDALKVNGQRLKPFLQKFEEEVESLRLRDPAYA